MGKKKAAEEAVKYTAALGDLICSLLAEMLTVEPPSACGERHPLSGISSANITIRVANFEFGMPDLSRRPLHAHGLLGAESSLIEVNRPGCIGDGQIRRERMIDTGPGLA
jgi:hypothetical protein